MRSLHTSLTLAAIVLLALSRTAHASLTYTIDVPLSNETITPSMGGGATFSAAGLLLEGDFNVPTLDPAVFSLSQVSFAFNAEAGAAAWTTVPTNSFTGTSIIQAGFEATNHQQTSTAPATGLASLVPYNSFPVDVGLNTSAFVAGSQQDVGGMVPIADFVSVFSSGAYSSGSGPTGAFVFIRGPFLAVTYTFDPLIPNYSSSLPATGVEHFGLTTYLNPNSVGPIPLGLLPSYVTDAPGDVNNDGIVNAQDLAQLASNWLHTGPNVTGDLNGDGIVNAQDLAQVASNWLGTVGTSSSNAAAVPEPSTLMLAALGGLALLAWRRR